MRASQKSRPERTLGSGSEEAGPESPSSDSPTVAGGPEAARAPASQPAVVRASAPRRTQSRQPGVSAVSCSSRCDQFLNLASPFLSRLAPGSGSDFFQDTGKEEAGQRHTLLVATKDPAAPISCTAGSARWPRPLQVPKAWGRG